MKKGKSEGCKSQCSTDTSSSATGSSRPVSNGWRSDPSQKAKYVDAHVPSLKRRKLGELTSICLFLAKGLSEVFGEMY